MLDLQNENLIPDLENQFLKIADHDDMEEALDLVTEIKKAITENPQFAAENPQAYRALLLLIDKLQFIRLPNVEEKELLELVGRRLIDGLSIPGYKLSDKIGTRLLFMNFPEDQNMFMEQFFERLKKNALTIGQKNITINDQPLSPTVQNWFRDYDNFPASNAARSYLDEVNYINKSPNAQSLAKEDRDKLLELLKVYDSLRNQVSLFYSLPEAKSQDEYFDAIDKVRGTMYHDGEVSDIVQQTTTAPQPQLVASPARVGQAAPGVVYKTPVQKAGQGAASEVLQSVLQKQQRATQAPTIPVNIQDVLKDQVSSGGGIMRSSPSTKTSAEPGVRIGVAEGGVDLEALKRKAQIKQADIEKKLEELKNRTKSSN